VSFLHHFQVISRYLSRVSDFNLPHLRLAPPLRLTQIEFCRDLWRQNGTVPGLLCGTVSLILNFAVLIQYRHVTDTDTLTHRHTTTAYTELA